MNSGLLEHSKKFVGASRTSFEVHAAPAADFMFQGADLPPITSLFAAGFSSQLPFIACMSYEAAKVAECHDATTKISYSNDGFVNEKGQVLASYADVMDSFVVQASLALPSWTFALEGSKLVVVTAKGATVEFNLENPEVSAFFLELGYSFFVAKDVSTAGSKSLLVLFNTGVARISSAYGSNTVASTVALEIFDAFLPAIMASANKGRTVGVSVFNDFSEKVVLREMRGLAAASPLPLASPTQMNMNDIDTFQVILWTAILLAVTLYSAVSAVATMEFSPDINSLYAKFNADS